MMPDASAWEAAGGVGVVIIFVSTLIYALRRIVLLWRPTAPASQVPTPAGDTLADLKETVTRLERDLAALRLTMAEHYLRRDDWVPTTSRVLGLLEQHSVALARLEERSLSTRRDRGRPRAE